MKSCPYCNAVLTDEANFCIYCMTSLDEKKKARPIKRKKKILLPLLLILTAVIIASLSSFAIIKSLDRDDKEPAAKEPQASVDPDTANTENIDSTTLYTYREALFGDDYSSAYIPDENDIIITGVSAPTDSGVYLIPSHIDGKRVLGIDPLSFSDEDICETVVKVVISDGIRNIDENVFAGCVNMTDIYFMGESLHTEINAFSQKRNGTLRIHCSETCDDRNFRLYKNNAEAYGAVYECFEGGDIPQ